MSSVTSVSEEHGDKSRSWLSRRPLLGFFLLAFAWTWGIILFAILMMNLGVFSDDAPLVAILSNLAPYGPAVAALAVSAALGGRAGVGSLLSQLNPRRAGLGWYFLALLAPPLILILAETAVYGAVPLTAFAQQWTSVFPQYLLFAMTIMLLTTGLGEELGWRGFALSRLQTRYGPALGIFILGVLSSLWHLPNAIAKPGGLLEFGLLTVNTIINAYIFSWAYNSSNRSVLIAALAHSAFNTSSWLLTNLVPVVNMTQFSLHIYMVANVVMGLVALLIAVLTRGRFGAPESKPDREAISPAQARPDD